MDLGELNLELYKCKEQRENYTRRLAKRKKLMEYFDIKRKIHLQLISKLIIVSLFLSMASFSFLFSCQILSHILLTFSFSFFPIIIAQSIVCHKFNRVIKALENNNKKLTTQMQKILQNEFELDMQIKNLKTMEEGLKTSTLSIKKQIENQQNLSL